MNSFKALTSYQTRRGGNIATAIAVAILASFSFSAVACKGKAETPAVNYSRIPDGAPQNSYADVVARVAPAVITIRANKRVRQPQQFPSLTIRLVSAIAIANNSSNHANNSSARWARA
jgi:S1-C subfamily serine protease